MCAGVSVNPAEDKGNGVPGSFEDPDGNEICLCEDSRKVSSFKSAVRSATTN